MTPKSRFIFAMLVMLFFAASAHARAQIPLTISRSYERPNLLSGQFPIQSACMMPPQGKLTRVGMRGREGMTKESDAWSDSLQTIVENHLKADGVKLVSASSALGSGASVEELRQVQLELEQKYESIEVQISKKPRGIGKSRYTVGDQIALLPCAAEADVVIFVDGQGQVMTSGKKRMNEALDWDSGNNSQLILTLADAKTGEIISYLGILMVNSGRFYTDADKAFGPSLDKWFKKMRLGTTSAAPRHTSLSSSAPETLSQVAK